MKPSHTGRGKPASSSRRPIPARPAPRSWKPSRPCPDVYAEWATNEKVAMDVAIGAAYAGRRALTCMKHVGLNVAADSLLLRLHDRHRGRPGHRRRPTTRADAQLAERAGQPALRQVRPRALPGAERQPGSQGHGRRGPRHRARSSTRRSCCASPRASPTRTGRWSWASVTCGRRARTRIPAQLRQVRDAAAECPPAPPRARAAHRLAEPTSPRPSRTTASSWATAGSASSPAASPTSTPARSSPTLRSCTWA